MNLSPLPIQKFFDNNGRPLVGGLLFTYVAGTSTKVATYKDSSGGPTNTNPVQLDYRGEANVWIDPALAYKFVLAPAGDTDPPTKPIWTVDNISSFGGSIGKLLWPITVAEAAAGFIDSDIDYVGPQGFLPRYRIVSKDVTKAAQNTTAAKKLWSPLIVDGPIGQFWFPNNGGGDTYYFNDVIEVRPGVSIDCEWSTLNLTKTLTAADDLKSFFMAIRDFTLENFNIVINVTGSCTNGGQAFRLGSRSGYSFGQWPLGIFDQDDLVSLGLPPMENMHVRNGTITSNNPYANSAVASFGIGGLRNVSVEDVIYIGSGATGPGTGFYYEFGWSSKNGFPDTAAGRPHWSDSHACNLVFRNIRSTNMNTASDNYAVYLVEPYNALIENIKDESGFGAVNIRVGEAHYFRPWTSIDTAGAGRAVTLNNITAQSAAGSGIAMNAAQGTATGYLSDANMALAGLPPLTPSQKVDLIDFSLDGFAITGANGIVVSGAAKIRNGRTLGVQNGISVNGDCPRVIVDNVELLDSTSVGFRANDAATLFANRKKFISVSNSKICGSTGAGISLDFIESARITNNQLGYNVAFDNANEATQTNGVSAVSASAGGVVCEGNYVTTSGGATAYNNFASGTTRGCGVYSPRGTVSYSGIWEGAVLNWTGVLTPGTSGSITPVAGQDVGRYTIRDKLVTATLYFGVNTVAAPVGTLTLSGLPIAAGTGTQARTSVTFNFNTVAATCTGMVAQLVGAATSFAIQTRFAAGAWTSNAADIINGSVIVVSLQYMID